MRNFNQPGMQSRIVINVPKINRTIKGIPEQIKCQINDFWLELGARFADTCKESDAVFFNNTWSNL